MIPEEIVNFGEGGAICGIFTPTQKKVLNKNLCIIFLNAGLIHKIGPNRIYKKLAENYSETGFTSFRLDFSGLGDSGFSSEKLSNVNGQVKEVKMAMNWLQENKGIDKFLLSGICSGAKVAWDTSLEDQRVIGLCLIDGVYAEDHLLRNIGQVADRHLKVRYYRKHMFSLDRWLKLLQGKSRLLSSKNIIIGMQLILRLIKKLTGTFLTKIRNETGKGHITVEEPDRPLSWEILFERGVKIQMIFCEGGNAIDIYKLTLSEQLNNYQRYGNLHSILVRDVDHTFTPIWSQNYLLNLTTSWLKKEFEEE